MQKVRARETLLNGQKSKNESMMSLFDMRFIKMFIGQFIKI